jgi:hypothetical protein
MAVYFLTGTLGAGKGLTAMARIKSMLQQGRRVVTNMDLNVEFLTSMKDKRHLIVRIPDKPTIEDLNAIGLGYDGGKYNENKFGGLFLDELGTWFNARSWNEKGRKEIIDWMIHARKKRWHVYATVQHIDMVDAQLRNGIGQFEVQCRNLFDFKIPIIGWLFKRIFKLVTGNNRIQMSVVKHQGVVIDRWWDFSPDLLYPAYDTQQEFVPPDWPDSKGMHSMLSAWDLKGRYHKPKTLRQKIKENQDYITIGSSLIAIVSMLISGIAVAHKTTSTEQLAQEQQNQIETLREQLTASQTHQPDRQQPEKQPLTAQCEGLEGMTIAGTIQKGMGTRYIFNTSYPGQDEYAKNRYEFRPYSQCLIEVVGEQCQTKLTCESTISNTEKHNYRNPLKIPESSEQTTNIF